jgi:hypothetical protein
VGPRPPARRPDSPGPADLIFIGECRESDWRNLELDDGPAKRLAPPMWEDGEGVKVLAEDRGVMVATRSPDAFYRRLPDLSLQQGTAIREVHFDDDNLEAVFKHLVNQ